LNLEASQVPSVNGDIQFLWESQQFEPHRIETPNLIETKFGTVDYRV